MRIYAIIVMFMFLAAGVLAASTDGASSGGQINTGITHLIYSDIGKGKTLTFNINKKALPVTQIMITGDKKMTGDVHIYIRRTYEIPKQIPKLDSAHSYFEVNTVNFNPDNYQDISFRFRLEKQWLLLNRLNETQVSLYRYDGSEWNIIPTRFEREEGIRKYYISSTDSFSYFGIAPKGFGNIQGSANNTSSPGPSTNDTIIDDLETNVTFEEDPEIIMPEEIVKENFKATVFSLIWGAIILILLYLLTKFYRKKTKKRKKN